MLIKMLQEQDLKGDQDRKRKDEELANKLQKEFEAEEKKQRRGP